MKTPAEIEAFWSDYAPKFDEEPDHGLRDPAVRAAWSARLASWMPFGSSLAGKSVVADLGCGTGSLSLLAAELGAEVVGTDLSAAMIEIARGKADEAGHTIDFQVGDASKPSIPVGTVDVVLCRHLIWTLPNPADALLRWSRLLKEGGRLILIEGVWSTQPVINEPGEPYPWRAGVSADQLTTAVLRLFDRVDHFPLSEDASLWGAAVAGEHYALVARDLRGADAS